MQATTSVSKAKTIILKQGVWKKSPLVKEKMF